MDWELYLEAERRGILPPDKAAVLQEARARGLAPRNETSMLEQGAEGAVSGLGQFVGNAADASRWAMNRAVTGGQPRIEMDESAVDPETGAPMPRVKSIEPQRPFGGPEVNTTQWVEENRPRVTNVPPQDAGQRLVRRAGEELGYGAVSGLGMAAKTGKAGVAGYNAIGDIASALGGQGVQEAGRALRVDPDITNSVDAITSSLLGMGATGVAAPRGRPPAPSTEELMARGVGKMADAKNAGLTLDARDLRGVGAEMDAAMADARARPAKHPKAMDARGEFDEMAQRGRASLEDVDDYRGMSVGRDVAGNKDEAAVGVAMKRSVDRGLDNIAPRTVIDPNSPNMALDARPSGEVIDTLKEGRRDVHQAKKAQEIEKAEGIADRSAWRAGSGGNTTNRRMQKVGEVLDREQGLKGRPGQRSGYTPDEIAAMEKVANESGLVRRLRQLSGLSPAKGALQVAGNVGGVGGAMALGLPAWMAAIPGGVGLAAHGAVDALTARRIAELLDTIQRGGVAVPKTMTDAGKAAVAAQLLSATDQ